MTASTLPPCDVLEWDSDFWKLRVARVRGEDLTPELARQIDGWCRQHAVFCLYFLARSDDVETVRLADDGGYVGGTDIFTRLQVRCGSGKPHRNACLAKCR